ncbi:MAG: cell envelope integrity protein TolA [Methylococcales bacterium]
MFNFSNNLKPLSYSVALHVLILLLFTVNSSSDPTVRPPMPATPEIIQAEALDETQVLQEVERLKAKEKKQQADEASRKKAVAKKLRAEEKKLKRLKKERRLEEKRLKDQRLKSAKAAAKEKKSLAKLKKQKQKALREKAALKKIAAKKKAGLERKKKSAAKKKADLERKKKAVAAKRKAEAEAKRKRIARQKYEDSEITRAMIRIERQVKRNWIRPSSVGNGLTCTIRVQLVAGGAVKSAQVIESSGNAIFDRSAENAVRKASPLPVPTDPLIFQKFKVFNFVFNPQ